MYRIANNIISFRVLGCGKMAKPSTGKQKQIAVSLTPDIRDFLEISSSAAGVSLSEEVRRRLVRTIQEDARDQNLRSLINDIAGVVEILKFKTGVDWHSDAATHTALRAAILALVGERRPDGSPLFSAPHELFGAGVSAGDDPETIGRQVVREYHLQKQSRSRS
jgi:hypothetical protein